MGQILITTVGFFVSLGVTFFGYHKYIVGYVDRNDQDTERKLKYKLDKEIYDREMKILDEWRREKDKAIQSSLDKINDSIEKLGDKIEKLKECH